MIKETIRLNVDIPKKLSVDLKIEAAFREYDSVKDLVNDILRDNVPKHHKKMKRGL